MCEQIFTSCVRAFPFKMYGGFYCAPPPSLIKSWSPLLLHNLNLRVPLQLPAKNWTHCFSWITRWIFTVEHWTLCGIHICRVIYEKQGFYFFAGNCNLSHSWSPGKTNLPSFEWPRRMCHHSIALWMQDTTSILQTSSIAGALMLTCFHFIIAQSIFSCTLVHLPEWLFWSWRPFYNCYFST